MKHKIKWSEEDKDEILGNAKEYPELARIELAKLSRKFKGETTYDDVEDEYGTG